MMKQLRIAALALVLGMAAGGLAQAGTINGMQQVTVCDATTNQGQNCAKPDSSGNLPVTATTTGYKSTVSFARTADTNAYTAGDVEGTGTGSAGASLEFDNIGPSAGGEIYITSSELEIDVSSVPSGMTSFRLYFYNVTPPSALGDNAAWDLPSGDRASFLGYIDLGSPVDVGSTLYVRTDSLNAQITAASGGKVFAYLVTNGGYTPTSGAVMKITLHAVGF